MCYRQTIQEYQNALSSGGLNWRYQHSLLYRTYKSVCRGKRVLTFFQVILHGINASVIYANTWHIIFI
jgi:hypothetical protein